MSDFTSNFWTVYISVITLVGMGACLVLLWVTGKTHVMSFDDSTGHVWDEDLREMNNPLPRWWVWMFVISVVFGFAYLALYPGLGSHAGTLGWTSLGEYRAEVSKAEADEAPLYAKFSAMTPEALSRDPQAKLVGERLFMNNCAQCHGSRCAQSSASETLSTSGNAAIPSRARHCDQFTLCSVSEKIMSATLTPIQSRWKGFVHGQQSACLCWLSASPRGAGWSRNASGQ